MITLINGDLIEFSKNNILKLLLSFGSLIIDSAQTKVGDYADNIKEYLYDLWPWVLKEYYIWNYLTKKRSKSLSSRHRYRKQLWWDNFEMDLEVADDDEPSECAEEVLKDVT